MAGKSVKITMDKSACGGCTMCYEICPLVRILGFKSLSDSEAAKMCLYCGDCIAICPGGLVKVGGMPEPETAGKIPTGDEMLNLIKSRRSNRAFKAEKVKKEDWKKLVEAIRYAPTAHNSQHVDLIIIESPEIITKLSQIGMKMFEQISSRLTSRIPFFRFLYRKMFGDNTYKVFEESAVCIDQQKELANSGMDPMLLNTPGIMLFIAPKSELFNKLEAAAAAQTAALLAPTLGMGTCYSGVLAAAFAMSSEAKKLVELPKGYHVAIGVLVGYAKHKYPFVSPRKERNVTYY